MWNTPQVVSARGAEAGVFIHQLLFLAVEDHFWGVESPALLAAWLNKTPGIENALRQEKTGSPEHVGKCL